MELFTGAGGLALGTSLAGFHHVAVVERDHDSCETLRINKSAGVPHIRDWDIQEADVQQFDYSPYHGKVAMVAGGVPCQPFSLGGKHKAHEDARDMFPQFARAVGELRPMAFIVENVKGLLRQSFADYFEYVTLRLAHPLIPVRAGQTWREHRAELERVHTAGKNTGLDYNVVFQLLNAANFGVPQKRERVFIVGFRSDLGIDWSFPSPTHTREALVHSQFVSGEYWDQHRVAKKNRPTPDAEAQRVVDRIRGALFSDLGERWLTVRDAIAGLPQIKLGETDPDDPDHFLNPGARSYKGHTGSPLDEPAKTLKAGDHGVPGGENTLALPDGGVRYFSPREAARLQTFPDEFRLSGSWTERMRQMGNAVPVRLARVVAEAVRGRLAASRAA